MKSTIVRLLAILVAGLAFIASPTFAADKKPNIVVIMGEYIG